ncbi:MAG: hypothetical protein M1828_005577 [Chrysothrix sp. TS-e1954]|nr:MAG: hypothetical protein M1828_005577 [Chrysothrix sp. TS-e1954]
MATSILHAIAERPSNSLDDSDYLRTHRIQHAGAVGRYKAPKVLDVNHENVQWLLSLPPKARQFHFSLEEQTSLTESSEPFGRSAHGFQNKRNKTSASTRPDFRTFSSMPPRCSGFELPPRQYTPLSTPLEEIDEMSVMACPSPIVPTERPDPRAGPRAVPWSGLAARRRPSLRQAMSFITVPHVHTAPATSSSPAPLLKDRRAPKHADSSLVEEPLSSPSEYYQDPETRLKLQRGLSSPQGFDEALKFGFPMSTPSPAATESRRPSTKDSLSSPLTDNDVQRFLRHNTLSFIDNSGDSDVDVCCATDEVNDNEYDSDSFYLTSPSGNSSRGGDGDSFSELDSPVTPQNGEIGILRHEAVRAAINQHAKLGTPSQSISPKVMRYYHDGEPRTLGRRGGWEETLRITLTKPELRASEEEIYGHAIGRPSKGESFESGHCLAQDRDGWKDLRSNEHGRMRTLWHRVWQNGSRY